MQHRRRRASPRWGLALAAAFSFAACNNSEAPQAQLSDPQGLSTDLVTVAGVLASPQFQSFSAVPFDSGSPVRAPTRAAALLRAAPIAPPRTADAPYTNAAARFMALSSAARLTSGISATVIPSTAFGTWEWSTTTHAYQQTSTTTPVDTVRVILYEVYPNGDIIENPLNAIGYADLVDESTTTPAVNKLHAIVKGGSPASPGATYVDYTVSATVTGSPPTAFTATASGSVTDLSHTLTFDGTFAATNVDTDNPDAQIDGTWDLDNPAIHIALHETIATPNANQLNVTVSSFNFTRPTQDVFVHGTVSVVLSPQTVTVNLAIDVNSVPWAHFAGTNQNIDVRHADGTRLSDLELVAFAYLQPMPDTVGAAILSLFAPCENLMGA